VTTEPRLTDAEIARSIKFAEKALARTLDAAAESRGLDVVTVAHSLWADLATILQANGWLTLDAMIADLRKHACQAKDTVGACAGKC
jgi:hypothetical protein